MKKRILNRLLFIAALFFYAVTSTVQAQSLNNITISVKDIQYDDPNFTALREIVKKNPKVKMVKPSYTVGVAILSFTYPGETAQLWEEIPKTTKRFFSLDELGDDAISLNYLNPKTHRTNSPIVTNAAQNKGTNKKDCFDCDYFPMCEYDETKSFGGRVYRGLRDNNGSITYYYCEKGEVTKIWTSVWSETEQATVYDPFKNVEVTVYFEGKDKYASHRQVILKSNLPEGNAWGESPYRCVIKEKGISVTVDGIKYNNVIVVYDDPKYYYYAKGSGLIKVVKWDDYMPEGTIDSDLLGVWIITDKSNKSAAPYWKFQADGTGIFSDVDETFKNDFNNPFKWRIIKNNKLYTIASLDPVIIPFKKLLPEISINGATFRKLTAKDVDNTAYTDVDVAAIFPGDKNWASFIARNLNMQVGEDNGAPKGTYDVRIRFTVAKDGTTKDFKSLTKFGYGLEEELLRLFKRPVWTPAKKNGRFVDSIVERNLVFKVPSF